MIFFAILLIPTLVNGKYQSSSPSYLEWLVKTVCLDSAGNLTSEDPFHGCSSGSSRKTKAGDMLTYNNFEQMGYQICDSFALLDSVGETLYFHTFDYEPFNEFNQYSGSDGYDVYAIMNDTVSVSNTKDGGGYGSTFFGNKCTFGNGWALFPTTDFLSGGEGYWPISGVYWEHNAESSPGPCPNGYSTNTLTSWELISGFQFSGMNGNPAKAIDTLVSYHGFETNKDGVSPTDNFLANGHLEVFYFTELYGLTRWEVWFPTASIKLEKTNIIYGNSTRNESIKGSTECSGSGTGVYKGVSFTISNCHDWSQVKPVPTKLKPTTSHRFRVENASDIPGFIPLWPLVNANLLQYPHFEAAGFSEIYLPSMWCRFGTSSAGNLINWSALISTTGGDANDGTGMAYLAFNCAAGEDGLCGSLGSQAIYQDIVINNNEACGGCTYLYGVNARTAPGQGEGTLQIGVQILDTLAEEDSNRTRKNMSAGTSVIWQTVFTQTVNSDNGDGRGSEAESVYLSSKFIATTATLPDNVFSRTDIVNNNNTSGGNRGADGRYVYRFLIMPGSSHTFHVSDAFFNRFPAPN